MNDNCYTGTNIPTPISENCGGIYTSTECIVQESAIPYLNLPANSSVKNIINNLVLALLYKDEQIANQTTIIDELQGQITDPRTYKVYTALLSQTGTDAPTAIVLENTLDIDVSWVYNDVGNYTLRAEAPLFEQGKVQLIQGSGNSSYLVSIWGYYNTPTEFIIDNYDLGNVGDGALYQNVGASMVDGVMQDQFIEIRVYN